MKRVFNSWQWLVLLVVSGTVTPWLVRDSSGPALPESLGSLVLRHAVTGAAAAAAVNRMHGRSVAEAWNAIGYYGSSQGGAVLYVILYPSGEKAREAEERMGAKLESGEYVFQGTGKEWSTECPLPCVWGLARRTSSSPTIARSTGFRSSHRSPTRFSALSLAHCADLHHRGHGHAVLRLRPSCCRVHRFQG
jgi:hypothetical protein